MPSKEELQAYKGANVAKLFPLYGKLPYKGTVQRVDVNDNKTPFRIVYEDGDSEWITLQELKTIIIKDSVKDSDRKTEKRKDDAPAAADDQQEHKKQKKQKYSKSSSQQQADPAAAAASAGTGGAKAAKAAAKKAPPPAAAASGGAAASGKGAAAGVTSFTITAGAARAAADKAAAGTSKDAAAAAASGKGAASGKSSKGAASGKSSKAAAAAATPPPAAAAAGTPGTKAAGKGAAGVGGASMSTADTQNMLTTIHQNAAPTADKLVHDRQVARMPRQGSGAAVLPAMSQAVVAGGHCYISLQSAPKPRHSTTPGKSLTLSQQPLSASGGGAAAIDYRAESEALLGELQRLLSHSGSDKRWLVKVRVTLRSMRDGLPGFQEAWNAWAQRGELPVMSLVEGAGPFSSAGVMLEATALINA